MLQVTKDRIVDAAWRVAGWSHHTDRRRRPPGAMIVAPSNTGNIGDAALLSGCIEELRCAGYGRIDLLTPEPDDAWPASVRPDAVLCLPEFLYRGERAAMARLALRMRAYDALYVIGADIIDGVYDPRRALVRLRLMKRAAEAGVRTVLVGSSISATPDPACLQALGELPPSVRLNVRDPVSRARLSPYLRRPPTIAADAAFLMAGMPVPAPPPRVAEWLEAMRDAGRTPLAVNLHGGQTVKEPRLLDAMRRVIHRLTTDDGFAVLLMPHDARPPSDVDVARALAAPARPSVHLYDGPLDPQAVRGTLARVPLSLTGRMHLAILGLGVGTIPTAVVYQGKFEGLYRLAGLPAEDMTLTPAALVADPDAMVARVRGARRDLERHRASLRRSLPAIIASARRNIVPGGPEAVTAAPRRTVA